MESIESAALRHLAEAGREATVLPADCQSAATRDIRRIAVIGGGTMGAGIAISFADNGFAVTLLEMDVEAAQRGLSRIHATYAASLARGRLTQQEMDTRLARIVVTTDYADLRDADLVIEAVFEDLAVKQQVFRRLDAVCRPGAILATNTSYQDVNAIAAVTQRPQDVIGMHFFSPANVMKLLEVVRAAKTDTSVVATVMELAPRIRKIPVLVGVCYGFVGNRMLIPYGREVQMLLLEGATPSAIDAAMESFGMAMGPCAVSDLAGLDIGYQARRARNRAEDKRDFRIADRLVEEGRLGQKNGLGYYRYESGKRERHIDAWVEAMIRDEAAARGSVPRVIIAAEIVERLINALVNEGARIIADGIAQRPGDIDLIYVNGYGFPAARGGPMFYAENLARR